ncbi:hypothetical protein V6N12_036119 [Hibiscus sabdariffa]|uniref:Uncharacterized protein n=1 Tax=Hibiscus sabdariffa TaxID=183260 RepID=A0ABR2EPP7_9ROSI
MFQSSFGKGKVGKSYALDLASVGSYMESTPIVIPNLIIRSARTQKSPSHADDDDNNNNHRWERFVGPGFGQEEARRMESYAVDLRFGFATFMRYVCTSRL